MSSATLPLVDIEMAIVDVKKKHCPQVECRFSGNEKKEACMNSECYVCEDLRDQLNALLVTTDGEKEVIHEIERAQRINSEQSSIFSSPPHWT